MLIFVPYSISLIVLFYFLFLLLVDPFCFQLQLFVYTYLCLLLGKKDRIFKVKLMACFYSPYSCASGGDFKSVFNYIEVLGDSWLEEETVV